jgi:hypothetical protein
MAVQVHQLKFIMHGLSNHQPSVSVEWFKSTRIIDIPRHPQSIPGRHHPQPSGSTIERQ